MRRNIFTIITVLFMLIGIGITVYPLVSNLLYEKRQEQLVEYYQERSKDIPEEEKDQAWQDCWDYNDSLRETGFILTDPFDEEQMDPAAEPYASLLNKEKDGVMGSIEIPCIDVKLLIYHGTEEEVLQKGVGHLQGTSLPVGGKGSHSVLSAHSGLPDKLMFTNLDQLQNGDVFYIDVLGEVLAYEVDQIKKVLPNETDDLMINAEGDYVTLVTCTPYGVNTHRLLVRGTRIPYEEAKKIENEETEKTGQAWRREYTHAGIIAGILFVVIFTVYYILKRRNKGSAGKRKRERVKIYQKKKMNSRKH